MYNRLYSNDRSHERRKDVKDMVADPYQVLGVSHSATEDEIRQAYRRLAKKYHPDLNPGDAQAAQKMNEVNEAYDLLKNPQAYQQQRAQQQAQQQARQAYQNRQAQGYYDPFDPFGFYSGQGDGQNRSDSYRTYYYYSPDDDTGRQQYQWNYHRPRRGALGILGKLLMVYFLFQIFFSLFGGCAYRRTSPYYYYYGSGADSSQSETYDRGYSGWNSSVYGTDGSAQS